MRTLLALLSFGVGLSARAADPPVDFNRDIRPILSDKCFACHGPDEKAAQGEAAARHARRGHRRQRDRARQARRERTLSSASRHDPDEVDAAAARQEAGRSTAEQVELLSAGSRRGRSSSSTGRSSQPVRSRRPGGRNEARGSATRSTPSSLARLEKQGLTPSPEADRVDADPPATFDLTGLPPTPGGGRRVRRATRAPTPTRSWSTGCSPRRTTASAWPSCWLDLVRYADTNGYHSDNHRDVWPLPRLRDRRLQRATCRSTGSPSSNSPATCCRTRPTSSTIASGYNRLLQTTEEGGAQAKEYLAKYAADRVRNASTVWLGATLGCAECHDHKFDPFTTQGLLPLRRLLRRRQEAAVGRAGADASRPPSRRSNWRTSRRRSPDSRKNSPGRRRTWTPPN